MLILKSNLFKKDGILCEGPLSEKNTQLLLVLKEPNGDKLDKFWFREVVEHFEKGRAATRYYNILGAFAKSILNKSHSEALSHCAYINLYPLSGNNNVSGGKYVTMMKIWTKKKLTPKEMESKSELEEILKNRLDIIQNALDANISVLAHFEIVEALITDERFKDKFEKTTDDYPENARYNIASYKYSGNENVKLYSIPHPSYTINYDYLANVLKISSIYPDN